MYIKGALTMISLTAINTVRSLSKESQKNKSLQKRGTGAHVAPSKIVSEKWSCFQFLALSPKKKHVRNVCHTAR